MTQKSMLALAGLAAAHFIFLATPPAQAGNWAHSIYYGGPFYRAPAYRVPAYPRPHYRPSIMTCREARQRVRYRGYRHIRAIDCEGRIYRFLARRHGRAVLVKVNAVTGAMWI